MSNAEELVAVDIGSTVVKVARIGSSGQLLAQAFHPRDFRAGVAKQVTSILDELAPGTAILACSSANSGLRVGILCLTKLFSGAVLQNQILSAGANPIFVHDLDEPGSALHSVDILLVGGGVDCSDAGPLGSRLKGLRLEGYRYQSLLYAGNGKLAEEFVREYPKAIVVGNPMAVGLAGKENSVWNAVRRAYLDDLVHKEGIRELKGRISETILPTPEVVSRGFHRAISNQSDMEVSAPCLLIDVGGATTDIHYAVEMVRDDSPHRPLAGSSVARYVFTDLGVVASRDTTLQQLRSHRRMYEFLSRVTESARQIYQSLREGEYEPSADLLAYACVFLSLDRLCNGRIDGLPSADLDKAAQIVLSGGAIQPLDVGIVERIARLFVADERASPRVLIDHRYQVWVDGITWPSSVPGYG